MKYSFPLAVSFLVTCLLLPLPSDGAVDACETQSGVIVCPAEKLTKEEVCSPKNKIMLIVSPEVDNKISRRLEILWFLEKTQENDVIRLYESPDFHNSPAIFEVVPKRSFGFSYTQRMEDFVTVDLKHPVCMGYWVAFWRDNTVIYSACLQTNPTWMEDYKRELQNLRLWDMFIPGTHDSSAYHKVYRAVATAESRLEMYVYTQEESILEQLLHGARCLDLRVGYEGGIYNAHHGIVKLYPFQEVLDDIKTFMENTKEILILDFHDFPIGFTDKERHLKFVEHLYKQLEPYLSPASLGWEATLGEIWDTGKTLIISYNNQEVVDARKDILWPPIKQRWGNAQNIPKLYEYLQSSFNSEVEGMWSAQAELTATFNNIVTNNLGGLRKMAANTNVLVTKWFRGRWGESCHIVAMDFIRASGIVSVAIEANLRRAYDDDCGDDMAARLALAAFSDTADIGDINYL